MLAQTTPVKKYMRDMRNSKLPSGCGSTFLDISFLSSESAMITGTIVNADLMISSSIIFSED
jgi:hypothetical protein